MAALSDLFDSMELLGFLFCFGKIKVFVLGNLRSLLVF